MKNTIELTMKELMDFAREVAYHKYEEVNRCHELYTFHFVKEEPKAYYDLVEELWNKKAGGE